MYNIICFLFFYVQGLFFYFFYNIKFHLIQISNFIENFNKFLYYYLIN